ncbi:hypothetical protein QP519_11015 [Weeksella virosa]|uniref:hypothetical protein n=1 Tax=Weeksella virosa TaxID=1014 RepID=UPI0025575D06|nr:hypothetical protein [Weeksella virosa]MDK7376062.1 hypothetical protein [Weeksella virosa]MDK7674398.1 hypothetical protein [Weeksella virosa]
MKTKATGVQLVDSTDDGELFDLKIDVVRDEHGVVLGGLVLGSTQKQNEASILLARPGEVKTMPTLGVGITDALLSEDLLEFRHRIREHFAMDGLNVRSLDFYNLNKFSIDAEYK